MATRFLTYGVALSGDAKTYQDTLLGNAAVKEWTVAGLKETEFYKDDEPYAALPG
ncbi:MAG: hypothetical protein O3A06_09030 [Proteobacteria bacterium]|nr:hypothetical protein [Pseudomonadota bacterium]MDA0983159.1 hypothetical protein [Pseudomonadota bacterium]